MEQIRWPKGGLNRDDSVEIMDPEDWSYAANIVDGRSFNAKNGEKENIRGTTLINSIPYTDANSKLIGVIRSAEDDLNYLFFYNVSAPLHCILKLQNDTISLVLQWSGLNFQDNKLYRINGGGLAGDLIYFTDDFNQPRCVHRTRYSGGSTPASEEEILHIRRAPIYPPETLPQGGIPSTKNVIADVQFSYQYEYEDGQLSVIGPWTTLVRGLGMDGFVAPIENVDLRIGTTESIPALVRNIKMVARKGNNGTPFYFANVDPAADHTLFSITYIEQNIGFVPSDYIKNAELVPITAKASCVTKSRAWFGNYVEGYDTPTDDVDITFVLENSTSIFTLGPTFAPNSRYRLGVVFHDDQGRSAGVMDKDWSLSTDREVTRTATRRHIRYSITGTPPSWATYYSLVMTKDIMKTFMMSSWFTANAVATPYVNVNSSTGVETYSITYAAAQFVRLDMADMNFNSIYYAFKEGDFAIVTNATAGTTFGPLKVRKVTASFVYVDPVDFGNAGVAFQCNFQLYTPNTATEDIYYEVGQRREIVGGVMDTIDYFVQGDTINTSIGSPHFMPQMRVKPNAAAWDTDIGKPYVQTLLGQVDKKTFVRHSSPFIPGTGVNGLSEFQTGDESSVPIDAVEIQKLQPTMKESTDGEVLLAICNSDTYSIYIDESRLSTNDGQSFLISQTRVIGDVRKQRSGFGTIHPESVHEEEGHVYMYDKLARAYARYATNGLFPISEYKMVDYFEDQSALNALSDIVVTGYDPFYKLIFVTFKNSDTNTKKTVAFSLVKERWISFYDFAPDGYVIGSNKLYSVVAGSIYKHDNVSGTGFNNFYGVTSNSVIDISFNDSPAQPKEWNVIQVQSSPNFYSFSNGNQAVATDALRVDISNRHGQATDIRYNEFEVDENMIYGEIRGDSNSTGGVLNGDPIYSNTIQASFTFSGGSYKQLVMLKAGCEPSRGHNL
jgi:hypothetical protein